MHKIFSCLCFINLCLAFNVLAMDPPSNGDDQLVMRQLDVFNKKREQAKKQAEEQLENIGAKKDKAKKKTKIKGTVVDVQLKIEMPDEPIVEQVVGAIVGQLSGDKKIVSLALTLKDLKGLKHFTDKLSALEYLKILKLTGGDIDKQGMTAFAQSLGEIKSLQTLGLKFSNLNNEILADLMTAARSNEELKVLSLNGVFDDLGIIAASADMVNNNLDALILITSASIPENFRRLLPDNVTIESIENGYIIKKNLNIAKRLSSGSPNKSRKNISNHKKISIPNQ